MAKERFDVAVMKWLGRIGLLLVAIVVIVIFIVFVILIKWPCWVIITVLSYVCDFIQDTFEVIHDWCNDRYMKLKGKVTPEGEGRQK